MPSERKKQTNRDWYLRNKKEIAARKQERLKSEDSPIKRRRAWFNSLKERIGCLNPNCEWIGDYKSCLLDFHHIDPTTKSCPVSQMLSRFPTEQIMDEMRKCTLVCACCHRLITWGGLDDKDLPPCQIDE